VKIRNVIGVLVLEEDREVIDVIGLQSWRYLISVKKI